MFLTSMTEGNPRKSVHELASRPHMNRTRAPLLVLRYCAYVTLTLACLGCARGGSDDTQISKLAGNWEGSKDGHPYTITIGADGGFAIVCYPTESGYLYRSEAHGKCRLVDRTHIKWQYESMTDSNPEDSQADAFVKSYLARNYDNFMQAANDAPPDELSMPNADTIVLSDPENGPLTLKRVSDGTPAKSP